MSRSLGSASLLRCLLVSLSVTTGGAVLMSWLLSDLGVAVAAVGSGSLDAVAFDRALVWLCEVALVASAGWASILTWVIALEVVRGRSRARRGIPVGLRRLVLAACGVAVVGGVAGSLAVPSYAGSADDGDGRESVLTGLPLPDRATAVMHVGQVVAQAAPRTGAPGAAPAPALIVVRRGDTLWGLAAADHPEAADPATITARWRELYDVNRAVIGPDPDLILPGQQLRIPRFREELS